MTNPVSKAARGARRESVASAAPTETGRRSCPEWVADHPDRAIPKRVKLRVWQRCDGKCALTGRKLRPGDPHDFDHIIALANGGAHRESNLRLVSREAHREKTGEDAALKAKLDRLHAKHFGYYPESKQKIKSRGFDKRRPMVYSETAKEDGSQPRQTVHGEVRGRQPDTRPNTKGPQQ
jgi:5-methylcytosine-specific restriction protein A